jgi:hypothetical protein
VHDFDLARVDHSFNLVAFRIVESFFIEASEEVKISNCVSPVWVLLQGLDYVGEDTGDSIEAPVYIVDPACIQM